MAHAWPDLGLDDKIAAFAISSPSVPSLSSARVYDELHVNPDGQYTCKAFALMSIVGVLYCTIFTDDVVELRF